MNYKRNDNRLNDIFHHFSLKNDILRRNKMMLLKKDKKSNQLKTITSHTSSVIMQVKIQSNK